MNFNRVAYYYDGISFSSIYYDSIYSLFYVLGGSKGVAIFDTNCNFQRYMTLGGYISSFALSYFNGNLYGDNFDGYYSFNHNNGYSIVVASKANGAFVANYNNICSSTIGSITIDSFGYMAVGCGSQISLYSANNCTFLNQLLEISPTPLFTAVDSIGRFVSMNRTVIDIYY